MAPKKQDTAVSQKIDSDATGAKPTNASQNDFRLSQDSFSNEVLGNNHADAKAKEKATLDIPKVPADV